MRHLLSLIVLLTLSTASFAESPYHTDVERVCENEFALCTSAPCVPDPSNPDGQAICECEVAQGRNFGTSTCDDRRPKTTANGALTVLSTYAFVQAPTHAIIACEAGSLWTDCLDMPCVVDQKNPLRAICTCDIKTEGAFVTYGGACNKNTCHRSLWSAASINALNSGNALLMEFYPELSEPPYKFCPGDEALANRLKNTKQ